MCGIAGFASRTRTPALGDAVHRMRHRGPDALDHRCARVGEHTIGLGHARLAILDLSAAANQPFTSADGRFVTVFNGEIYNHSGLRDQLRARGIAFRTRSDTEVMVEAYRAWGPDCVRRFDGMFAFAILDTQAARIFLARDQFGIKPLYYAFDEATHDLYFASELRALVALTERPLEPDPAYFAEFLLNGWLYDPHTGIRGIEKLGIGERAELDLGRRTFVKTRYADPLDLAPSVATEQALAESMALQIEADVPVGLFFSGGVDSAVLAATSPRPLQAIYVAHPDASTAHREEERLASEVAGALDLACRVITAREGSDPDSVLESFAFVARGTEEPISDYTFAAAARVSAVAREAGYKVMLSGMGGDELFAGYPRYRLARRWRAARLVALPARAAAPILRRLPRLNKRADRLLGFLDAPDFGSAYTRLVGYFSPAEVERLLGGGDGIAAFQSRLTRLLDPVRDLPLLKRAMYLDRYGYLSHNLMVTDKASMLHSVEVRVPLITEQLAAAGSALDDAALLGRGGGKQPLRRILRRRLPSRLIDRAKVGFNPPLDDKLRVVGRGRLREILHADRIGQIIDRREVDALLERHFSLGHNETYRLWQLAYFGLWLEQLSPR